MRIIGIVQLPYEAPWDLPICVQRLCGLLYGNISQQALYIPTAVAPKCRLHHICPLGMVYCNVHYHNCTPTVRGATAPPNLCTNTVALIR